jgi:hypothetical protein
MLAKTPDDDLAELALAVMFIAADGGQPPVETVVTERPRRKPPRHKRVESIRDQDGKPSVVRVTAAPGFVLDSVVLQEFDGQKCKCTVMFSPSRGKPRGDRAKLADVVRALNARRMATDAAKPNGAGES